MDESPEPLRDISNGKGRFIAGSPPATGPTACDGQRRWSAKDAALRLLLMAQCSADVAETGRSSRRQVLHALVQVDFSRGRGRALPQPLERRGKPLGLRPMRRIEMVAILVDLTGEVREDLR